MESDGQKSIWSAWEGEKAQGSDRPCEGRCAGGGSNSSPGLPWGQQLLCVLSPLAFTPTTLINARVARFLSLFIIMDQNTDWCQQKFVCASKSVIYRKVRANNPTCHAVSSCRGSPCFTASVLLGIGYFTYKINTEYKKCDD